MDHIGAAGALVKVIHILGDEFEVGHKLGELGQGHMPEVGLRRVGRVLAGHIPLPNRVRIRGKARLRGQLLGVKTGP